MNNINDEEVAMVYKKFGSAPKASVGEGTVEGLKAFLEKKTGKQFGPVGGMLRVRKNLFYFIKKKMDEKAAGKGSEE